MSNFLKSELKDFQKETVDWMKSMEGKCGGGLLLNEPGTGKTVCCLSLTQHHDRVLVVCPAGVVNNWITEIEKHKNDQFNVRVVKYHGPNRPEFTSASGKDTGSVCRPEGTTIVITSYTVLVNEWKAETPFLENNFNRIILDEGHYIRNKGSTYFKSCKALKGTAKWVVTATPIFNKEKDLYAYFDFLEIPVDTCKGGNVLFGLRNLREIVKRYSICKTKDALNITKKKEEVVVKLEFKEEELQFYNAFREYSSIRIERLYKKMKMTSNARLRGMITSNMLSYILRLKQCCNHPLLVVRSLERIAKTTSITQATEVLRYYSTNKMVEEDCAICYERQTDTILTCGHKFCHQCISQIINSGHQQCRCPMCRRELVVSEYHNSTTEMESDSYKDVSSMSSSKIDKVIDMVKEYSSKIVIVSQWTGMLDILKENSYMKMLKGVDLRGGMSLDEKAESIRQFRDDDTIRVCYMSLTSSAEGIDLTVANKMIFLDMWWNDAKMIQASDRIHRIGQKENVYIYILQMTESIEEDIYKMAKGKGQLANILTRSWKGRHYEVSMIENVLKSLRIEFRTSSKDLHNFPM